MRGERAVLCVQDGTDFSFAEHRGCQGLGYIRQNKGSRGTRGLHLRSMLAVSEEGLPLGLLRMESDAPRADEVECNDQRDAAAAQDVPAESESEPGDAGPAQWPGMGATWACGRCPGLGETPSIAPPAACISRTKRLRRRSPRVFRWVPLEVPRARRWSLNADLPKDLLFAQITLLGREGACFDMWLSRKWRQKARK